MDSELLQQTVKNGTAVYAACVATLSFCVALASLIWHIKNYQRDRGQLKLTAMVGRFFPPPLEPSFLKILESGGIPILERYAPDVLKNVLKNARADTDKPLLIITITNKGRRPVLVTKLGVEWKQPVDGAIGGIIVTRFLPKKIDESESVTEWTDKLSILNSNLKKIFAYDSVGNEWALADKDLSNLIEQARRTTDQHADKQHSP